MMTYTLETLPPLSEAQLAELKAMTPQSDSEIDLRDFLRGTEEQWKPARRGICIGS